MRRRMHQAALGGMGAALLAGGLSLLGAAPAAAQPSLLPGRDAPAMSDEPVTFTAQEVEYDQANDTVIARGRVEAWQGQRVLRADSFAYDRRTGVATATGNVTLIEPDGQILFADRAELTGGMRDAALDGLRALLADNARMVAAGARRTGGTITDLARVVYSPCNLCPEDPTRAPLWQLRARIASLHSDEQRVRYRDAALQFWGLPVFYTPYLSHPAPGAPRASGFLSPSVGLTRFLGGFLELPYYWAIDESSDAILATTLATRQAGSANLIYRRRFNSGLITLDGSVGHLGTDDAEQRGLGGHIYARGDFALDENWRAGAALNRASSWDYVRAYRYQSPRTLTSTAYLEGFWGTEAYARTDARWYQGLSQLDRTGAIPYVLPFAYGEYVLPRDALGGYLTADTALYAIQRTSGTDTRRLAVGTGYELPMVGSLGDVWTVRARADVLGGWVNDLTGEPNFGAAGQDGWWSNGNLRAALDWRMPLVRPAGSWGSQLLEPRVQFVTGPSTGRQLDIPNEDSLDLEFTDANLFALNRFPGRDRQEGGSRVDAAMRAAWLFTNGGQLEGLVGRSFRLSEETVFPVGSGLENRASDWVARARLAPVPWFELLGRTRLDGETGEARLWDVSATAYASRVSGTVGYLRSDPNPRGTIRQRDEVSLGGQLALTENWRIGAFGRYDIEIKRPVAAQAVVAYEDECLIFETRLVRNWEEQTLDGRNSPTGTTLFFRVTLKTVGDFGIRAL